MVLGGKPILKILSIVVRGKLQGYAGGTQMKKVENPWDRAISEKRPTLNFFKIVPSLLDFKPPHLKPF